MYTPQDNDITNFMFVEYRKCDLTKEAQTFVDRFYGTLAFWVRTKKHIQICGTSEDVHVFVDYLKVYCRIPAARVLYGEAAMEAMMQ